MFKKNHAHVKKVGHTSECIFWHLLMNLKKKNIKKTVEEVQQKTK